MGSACYNGRMDSACCNGRMDGAWHEGTDTLPPASSSPPGSRRATPMKRAGPSPGASATCAWAPWRSTRVGWCAPQMAPTPSTAPDTLGTSSWPRWVMSFGVLLQGAARCCLRVTSSMTARCPPCVAEYLVQHPILRASPVPPPSPFPQPMYHSHSSPPLSSPPNSAHVPLRLHQDCHPHPALCQLPHLGATGGQGKGGNRRGAGNEYGMNRCGSLSFFARSIPPLPPG